VWASRYTPGGHWSPAVEVGDASTFTAFDPQVATDPAGNAVVVWMQSDSRRGSIWVNRYVADIGWGAAMQLETDRTCSALFPQIAMDSKGNAIAVWEQSDGARYNVWSSCYTPGKGWAAAQRMETDYLGNAESPQIAFDAQGNAVAVWCQSDAASRRVWANHHEPSRGWGSARPIDADNGGDAFDPQIAMDGSGKAMVVWEQSNGARTHVWASRYVPGRGWRSAKPIETEIAGNGNFPQVAIHASGNAIVVWKQEEGMHSTIWASVYR
jgi:hypothetical protein